MSRSLEGWLPGGVLAGVGPGFREEFRAYEELSYEYNEFGVFTNEQGEVFVGMTSGCSCSSPWDDTTEAGLVKVHDVTELRRKLNEWNNRYGGHGNEPLNSAQLVEALARISDLRLF